MSTSLPAGMSRRALLRSLGGLAGLAAAAALLDACSSAPPASAPAAGATVAAVAPTAQAAAATAAPTVAAAATTVAAAVATQAPAVSTGASATLDMWMLHPEWKDAMAKVVSDFQTANPGITLNVMPQQSATYSDQIQTALNAGTGPDLFQADPRPKLDVQRRRRPVARADRQARPVGLDAGRQRCRHRQQQGLGGARR